ncbi:MAG: glutamate synthase-related protein, partial [Deltaproteobacteria bacterium]
MMRACHLNTCPVGVATQDPELRKRYEGKPEHVIAMMTFIAEELREIMASLGFRTIDEMVGRTDMLEPDETAVHRKSGALRLDELLFQPEETGTVRLHGPASPPARPVSDLEKLLAARTHAAIEHGTPVRIEVPVRNVDRTVGARLSASISRRHGAAGLADDTITIACEGTAGQSFGAFAARGVTLLLTGEANDYVGKGLSGGRIVVQPPATARFVAEDNAIVGNVVLYGATSGELFARGRAGERFAVRNSGATAVVEGVGDHGCEYMTHGVVVCLGPTGRNFAAGMSGGVAYVVDSSGTFARRCNMDMVDLEPLDEEDRTLVRGLLHRHHEYTGSPVAWRMLSGWKTWVERFVKVLPREYRRALEAERRAREPAANA